MRAARPDREVDPCFFKPNSTRDQICGREITLDGITYRCARFCPLGIHDGIHDANLKHNDGGLVRW